MFKKIYLEITNICNLNCSFCPGNSRSKQYIKISDFKIILDKIKGYTNYVYFHLMGEPLMHPKINELIDYASSMFKVYITTNGYNIKRIMNNKNISQIHISLHSYDVKYNKSLNKYLNDIYNAINVLVDNNTYISLRLWVNNKYESDIIKFLEEKFKVNINGNTKLKDKVYLEYAKEFIWPDINNSYYNEEGSCMALRSHIGILVDGSVVPCCLDYNANLKLGNILEDDLDTILNSNEAIIMKKNFKNNKKIKEICKHCNFYDRLR